MDRDWVGIIPVAASLAGSLVGKELTPEKTSRSVLLATAAGLVTSSLITDVSPVIDSASSDKKQQQRVITGMLVGALAMVALRSISSPRGKTSLPQKEVPMALLSAAALDFFIDGVIIGQGLHSTIPWSLVGGAMLETFVVSSSIITIMKARGCTDEQLYRSGTVLASSSFLGILVGHHMGRTPSVGEKALSMGFASSVLLWMVAMDLLPEALAAGDGAWYIPGVWLFATAGGVALDWKIQQSG